MWRSGRRAGRRSEGGMHRCGRSFLRVSRGPRCNRYERGRRIGVDDRFRRRALRRASSGPFSSTVVTVHQTPTVICRANGGTLSAERRSRPEPRVQPDVPADIHAGDTFNIKIKHDVGLNPKTQATGNGIAPKATIYNVWGQVSGYQLPAGLTINSVSLAPSTATSRRTPTPATTSTRRTSRRTPTRSTPTTPARRRATTRREPHAGAAHPDPRCPRRTRSGTPRRTASTSRCSAATPPAAARRTRSSRPVRRCRPRR